MSWFHWTHDVKHVASRMPWLRIDRCHWTLVRNLSSPQSCPAPPGCSTQLQSHVLEDKTQLWGEWGNHRAVLCCCCCCVLWPDFKFINRTLAQDHCTVGLAVALTGTSPPGSDWRSYSHSTCNFLVSKLNFSLNWISLSSHFVLELNGQERPASASGSHKSWCLWPEQA